MGVTIQQNNQNKNDTNSHNKKARRRAAYKQNKKLLKALDDAQAAKFRSLDSSHDMPPLEHDGDGDGDSDTNMNTETDDDQQHAPAHVKQENGETSHKSVKSSSSSAADDIELIVDTPQFDVNNPAMSEMKHIFERFEKLAQATQQELVADVESDDKSSVIVSDHDMTNDDDSSLSSSSAAAISRRALKQATRLKIHELKQLVSRPDVVEMHDVNAPDPRLLIQLKSYRNTVPVPQHWCLKRKYLQGKRGYEKPPFTLPPCIANTGIMKMRGAQQEKEADMKNKQKQRSKMQPKMGKIDIDYQILHDAFFRYQTKPPMTQHGTLYYEGRENEVKMMNKRPCEYSSELREALGMSSSTSPPPWLFAMQRYGPPPAYTQLRIQGVNAPLPPGAKWGFGEGEWGKAPVDAFGAPLYGDVFGAALATQSDTISRELWGVLESEDEQDEEEEAEEEVEQDAAQQQEGADDMETEEGVPSTSGTASVVTSGLVTPETINLRKDGTGTETPDLLRKTPALYTVLEEKQVSVGGGLFGTSHTYALPVDENERKIESLRAKARGQVDVALAPEDLEGLDAVTLKRKYEAQIADKDDEVEFDANEIQKKKRKKTNDSKKQYKDFKF